MIPVASNEAGARSLLAALQSIYLLPSVRPTMCAVGTWGKPSLIQVDYWGTFPALSKMAQQVFLTLFGALWRERLRVP
jgi:hypothetical protein